MPATTQLSILLLCITVTATGCSSLVHTGGVRRRLTIETNPPGAAAYVDNQYVGTTPTATSFTYYGTREIEVVLDGYRTEKVLRTFNPPWYELPPLDFVTETLWPKKTRDERIVNISMVPQQVMSSEELQARASNLRVQAAQGVATPLPPNLSAGAVPGGQVLPPIDPTYPSGPGPIVSDPTLGTSGPMWVPGQYLREFIVPGGSPPTRIPEAGILPGGGYRPEVDPIPNP